MEWWQLLITVLGGFVAGVINTLAGNGSAITLTILTEVLHVEPNLANGTNRVGVAAQSGSGLWAFSRRGRWDLSGTGQMIWISLAGGILGAWLATTVSNDQFMGVFRFMMVFMLLIALFKPERWIRDPDAIRPLTLWVSVPVYLLIGIYSGFIQMGMGIFFLAVTVLVSRYPIMKANVAKNLITFVLTCFSLIAFQLSGMIHWEFGLLMAAGQACGAWLSAHYASGSPSAALWAYRLLILGIVLSVVKLFDLHRLVLDWLPL